MLEVKSNAFEKGRAIPKRHTGEGENVSPPIRWGRPSRGVESYALICDDPDAPRAKPFVHWVLYDIPPDRHELPEAAARQGVEGLNDFGKRGYGGPMPPKGHGTHHYHFKVYALDRRLGLAPGASKDDVLDAMRRHVVDEGEIVGTYER